MPDLHTIKNSPDGPDGARRPIFIQAMWRTGSTYIWKKFRDQPQYRAYYQPLHEILMKPREEILAAHPESQRAALRHPPIEEFYFAEFPFTEGGGVEHFEKPLSYERYCLAEDAEDLALHRYISHLLTHATRYGQTPVLQFNRGLFRAGWLTRHFSPVNLLLLRRPANVWKSFLSFPDSFFVGGFCMILGQNRFRFPLSCLPAWTDIPRRVAATTDQEYAAYAPVRREQQSRLYPAFFDFYLLSTIHCAQYADCILDMDELAHNPAARQAATARLRQLGISISLDDCVLPSYPLRSPEEREWLAYEDFSRRFLRGTLPSELSIPREKLAAAESLLGPYFRDLLTDFTDRPAPSLLQTPAEAASRAHAQHESGLELFGEGQVEAAARAFGDSLAEEASCERWNDWATAQSALARPVLAELGYRQALRMDSTDQEATTNLGALLAMLGKDSEALPLLDRAGAAAPPESRAILTGLAADARQRLGLHVPAGSNGSARSTSPASLGQHAGLTVFLTGLSGAGKSTVATALLARLAEVDGRPVTLLDGDNARRLLSSELGFSREHRNLNIRRIGFVAAEVTRHGGTAICAPIAPFDRTRREVRDMIEPLGAFVLVYLSTPIEVCEERDPKGLYARARAGHIPFFTGISDPYEVPADADLMIDTTDITPEQTVNTIVAYLWQRGILAGHAVETLAPLRVGNR